MYIAATTGVGGYGSLLPTMGGGAASDPLFLDTYSGVEVAYSLRKVNSIYTGPAIEVYNGSSYLDIPFASDGLLDTVALAAHCGVNDGLVRRWYDQSGNANDAFMISTTKMPKIFTGGATILQGTQHALSFDGVDDYMVSVSNYTHQENMSQVMLTKADVVTTDQYIGDGLDRSKGMGFRSQSGLFRYYVGNGSSFDTLSHTWNTNHNLHIWGRSNSDSKSFARLNGSETSLGYTGFATTSMPVYLGARSNGSLSLDAQVQEYILFLSDQTDNKVAIETNINDYYSVY